MANPPNSPTPVVASDLHRLHAASTGTWVGVTIRSEEIPERIDEIVKTLESAGHPILATGAHDDRVLETVHDRGMIEWMRGAHAAWIVAGYPTDPGQDQVTAYAFPTERFLGGRPLRLPTSPGALAGVYAMDTMTQVGAGTWEGARAAVDTAMTAADLVAHGARSAYAACRPPGHHAGRDYFGGSCYLNNAAVAVETLRAGGLERIATIDIDAHHGNGTQEIFYGRDDVITGSVHVDPAAGWFPHFVGHADEVGSGRGEGHNRNVPIPPGSDDDAWLAGLDRLVDFAAGHRPDAIVVSLGVDAEVSDPESPLRVTAAGFTAAGERVASLGLPTVFVQEGGYVLSTIGELVAAVITGFDRRVNR